MPAVINTRAKGRVTSHIEPGARKVLRNTYSLLALTMVPTVIGAVAGVQYPIFSLVGFWPGFLLFMVMLFGLQAMIVRNRNSMAGINWLLLFTFCMGFFLGPMLGYALSFSNGVDLIALSFGGTAAIFLVLAGYATTTSTNFATPGIAKVLFIGLMMVIAMWVVGLLFQVPGLSLAISAVMMLIASGYIVYTINSIVRGGETNYILATLTVYIMLYNLFQSLLHLLLAFSGNRD